MSSNCSGSVLGALRKGKADHVGLHFVHLCAWWRERTLGRYGRYAREGEAQEDDTDGQDHGRMVCALSFEDTARNTLLRASFDVALVCARGKGGEGGSRTTI